MNRKKRTNCSHLFDINQHWSSIFLLIHSHPFSLMFCGPALQLAAGQSDVHTCGQRFFFFSCYSCHHRASWLHCQPETPEQLLSCQYHSSALYLLPFLPSLLSAPLPCSVICSPPSSYSLINALIKGATSKSRLQGLRKFDDKPKEKHAWHASSTSSVFAPLFSPHI